MTATPTRAAESPASLSPQAEALLSRLRLGPARLCHVADLLDESGESKLSKPAMLAVLRFELWERGFRTRRAVDDEGRLWFWLDEDSGLRAPRPGVIQAVAKRK